MIVNDQGRNIIMLFEGCRLEAYKCPAGITTIGYGHTGDVEMGNRITQHQAEAILEFDLHRFEQGVSDLAPKANPNQFSAMVCLAFNVGLSAFKKSRLLARHLEGNHRVAALEFGKWIHGGGKILPGLVKRRAAEAALYLEGVS